MVKLVIVIYVSQGDLSCGFSLYGCVCLKEEGRGDTHMQAGTLAVKITCIIAVCACMEVDKKQRASDLLRIIIQF